MVKKEQKTGEKNAVLKPKEISETQPINRRTALLGMGAIGTASVIAACSPKSDNSEGCVDGAPAILGKKRTLKMVTSWPKNFPGLGTGANRIAKNIEDITEGRITVKVYAGGELVGPFGVFDAVSQGKADLYHSAEYYWQGKSQAFNFFAAVPFGMTGTEMNAWIRFGGGQELWDALSAKFSIKPMMVGNSGVQMGGWYKRDMNSLDDFQGLRIRMPGLGGTVMERMGATPVTKPGSELFQALSTGNIDATEWIGPWNDLAFGFHTIVKNYYYPGIHEPGTTLSMGINLDLWEEFTPSEKAIFTAACATENDYLFAEYNARNARALTTLINDHNVTLKKFSDDILTHMKKISAEVLLEAAASDPFTNEVYQSFTAALKASDKWGSVSEQAYLAARSL